ncbi:RNA polymerase sigma factor SigM [Rosistilla oblonga]|nr:RNA polymerase sigma factor SigM [Rosistilla oblonga]
MRYDLHNAWYRRRNRVVPAPANVWRSFAIGYDGGMNSDVTNILEAIDNGDQQAAEQLLPIVYQELRRLAASRMTREKAGHTLQPTALVHEAFMRLVGGTDRQKWSGREHFFAAAAESMRRILIESARRRNAEKRGGGMVRADLGENDAAVCPQDDETLLALNEALIKLQDHDARLAKLVELRYFTGMTIDETANVLGVSSRTVKRNWTYARAWLRNQMDGE